MKTAIQAAAMTAAVGCSDGGSPTSSAPEDTMPVCKAGERQITHDCWEQPQVNEIEPDEVVADSNDVVVVDWEDPSEIGSSSSVGSSSSTGKKGQSSSSSRDKKRSSSSIGSSSSTGKKGHRSSSSEQVLYSSSSSQITYDPSSSSYTISVSSSSQDQCNGQAEFNECAILNPENGSPKKDTPGINEL